MMTSRHSSAALAAVLLGAGLALASAGCNEASDTSGGAANPAPTPSAKTTVAKAPAAGPSQVIFETPGFDTAMKSVKVDKPAKPAAAATPPPAPAPGMKASGPSMDAAKRLAMFKKVGEELIQAKAHPRVTVQTSRGTFVLEVDPEGVPVSAANFLCLAGHKFYDGLMFHRVEAGFVIQGGDPLGTGKGGPGYTIPDEYGPLLHGTGALAMAKANEPDSAGSQWYVTLSPQANLDHKYTVFGKVVSGMEVVSAIQKDDLMTKLTVSGLPAGFKLPDPHASR